MKKIQEIKRILKLTNNEIAKMFEYKNTESYTNSSAKERIEKGLEKFYNHIKQKENENKN